MPFVSKAYLSHLPDQERQALLSSHLPLGYHPVTQDTLFIAEADRFAGTYVIGVQGVGKSGLLENMIAHDVRAGHAVVVIDPHGDLVKNCLAQLPPERSSDAYVLDMTDEDFPFGINLFTAAGHFSSNLELTQAVDRIMHIFEVLWPEVSGQQHLPLYLRGATLACLANPGSTLVDMQAFLTDQQVRDRMLQAVPDPSVRQFWRTQYDDLAPNAQANRVQPLVGRLNRLFMGRSLITNIVGQRQTTINFRRAIDNREVLLINLPVKRIPEDARLIGTILVSLIHAAIFSFADVPQEKRPGLSFYLDEFQHFATSDIEELFTEGRKFGVRLTIAHQFRDKLPDFLQAATMTARTKVVFQTTPDDAREMAHLFPNQHSGVDLETISPNACTEFLERTADFPENVQQFVEVWLRPLFSRWKTRQVEIQDVGFHPVLIPVMVAAMFDGGGGMHPKVQVPNPVTYLNSLLYEVMRRQNPHLPIPTPAIVGFSDLYKPSFYQYAIRAGDTKLNPAPQYPAHLVVFDGQERLWTRHPDSATEWLWHLIFSIREVMGYLAEHPIGDSKELTPTEIARMIQQLPRRTAFVRSAETVGVMYTHPLPRAIGDTEYQSRDQQVRRQTRAKYCRPRAEVEAELRRHLDDPSAPVAAQPPQPAYRPPMPASIPDEVQPGDSLGATLIDVNRRPRWQKVDE